jgi:hypothetical protein
MKTSLPGTVGKSLRNEKSSPKGPSTMKDLA